MTDDKQTDHAGDATEKCVRIRGIVFAARSEYS